MNSYDLIFKIVVERLIFLQIFIYFLYKKEEFFSN